MGNRRRKPGKASSGSPNFENSAQQATLPSPPGSRPNSRSARQFNNACLRGTPQAAVLQNREARKAAWQFGSAFHQGIALAEVLLDRGERSAALQSSRSLTRIDDANTFGEAGKLVRHVVHRVSTTWSGSNFAFLPNKVLEEVGRCDLQSYPPPPPYQPQLTHASNQHRQPQQTHQPDKHPQLQPAHQPPPPHQPPVIQEPQQYQQLQPTNQPDQEQQVQLSHQSHQHHQAQSAYQPYQHQHLHSMHQPYQHHQLQRTYQPCEHQQLQPTQQQDAHQQLQLTHHPYQNHEELQLMHQPDCYQQLQLTNQPHPYNQQLQLMYQPCHRHQLQPTQQPEEHQQLQLPHQPYQHHQQLQPTYQPYQQQQLQLMHQPYQHQQLQSMRQPYHERPPYDTDEPYYTHQHYRSAPYPTRISYLPNAPFEIRPPLQSGYPYQPHPTDYPMYLPPFETRPTIEDDASHQERQSHRDNHQANRLWDGVPPGLPLMQLASEILVDDGQEFLHPCEFEDETEANCQYLVQELAHSTTDSITGAAYGEYVYPSNVPYSERKALEPWKFMWGAVNTERYLARHREGHLFQRMDEIAIQKDTPDKDIWVHVGTVDAPVWTSRVVEIEENEE